MRLKIGITGGIGVGKSMVTRIFKLLNIPTYDADKEAKNIMVESELVRTSLLEAFGQQVYHEDGSLNKMWLSNQVFSDQKKLTTLNSIVHPVVIQHGEEWEAAQNSLYTIKEAALLFESGSYSSLDYTILVTSPQDVRIARVMQRDQVSQEEVKNRMSKQMPEEKKMEKADFLIYNDDEHSLIEQVMFFHSKFTGQHKN